MQIPYAADAFSWETITILQKCTRALSSAPSPAAQHRVESSNLSVRQSFLPSLWQPFPVLGKLNQWRGKAEQFCFFPPPHHSPPTCLAASTHGAQDPRNQLLWGWKWLLGDPWSLHSQITGSTPLTGQPYCGNYKPPQEYIIESTGYNYFE